MVTGGGEGKYDYVTEYDLVDGTATHLTPLGQPRYDHACGVYQNADNHQVS